MKVVVVGASGNVGTSVLAALAAEPAVESVLGIARRLPDTPWAKTQWAQADIARDHLQPFFEGADVVVHLAWLIQPSRDLSALRAVNVEGSARVFRAVADAKVPALVYASSVGAYSAGPKDRAVDESWPTEGIPTSFYSRHKAETERQLDRFEREHPRTRVVRLRPGLCFKRDAGAEIRRYFIGPLLPTSIVRRSLLPLVPDIDRLRFQAVHSLDVGDAYRLAIVGDARGPFNIAADPVLDPPELARLLGARRVPVPATLVRGAAAATWRLGLQPTPAGWVDMGLGVPIMDTTRARTELGWTPARSSGEALLDLLEGIRTNDGLDTPPLAPWAGGPARIKEFATGIGRKTP